MWIIIDYMFELNTKIQAKYHKITNKLLEKNVAKQKISRCANVFKLPRFMRYPYAALEKTTFNYH